MALRHSGRFSSGSLAYMPQADREWHRSKTKKRWPIRCRECRHHGVVKMTEAALMMASFRCSECGSRNIAKRI